MLSLMCVGAVGEEAAVIKSHYVNFYVCQGQTVTPAWPDYTVWIGEGLSKDDFIITYERYDTTLFQINANGSVTVAKDAPISRWTEYDVVVKYTPKVEGVGETTEFRGATLAICEPIENIPVAGTVGCHLSDSYSFWFTMEVPEALKAIEYDKSMLDVTYSCSGGWKTDWQFKLVPKKLGVTTIRFVALNDLTKVMKVFVEPDPTQVKFAQNVFKCYYRDKVDLGVDYGYGTDAKACPKHIRVDIPNFAYDGFSMYAGEVYFRRTAPSVFEACREGYHTVTYETHNGFSGSVRVHVYSNKNATRMILGEKVLREGYKNVTISLYSDNGEVFAPLKITKGADIASIYENKLTLTGTGTIEITATNPDGSTLARTFVVEPYPTEMILNAEEVTLRPMESFELEVGFDKGSLPYSITATYDYDEKYGIAPAELQGLTVTAQNPGKAVYTITTDDKKFEKTFTVHVINGDKAVYINLPPEPFGVGHSYQMYVRDGNGKIVPAVFSEGNNNAYSGKADLTAGGYITGTGTGNYELCARLEDGRVLTQQINISQIPSWLRVDAVVLRKSDTWRIAAESDVGSVTNMTYKIANTSIIKIEDGVIKPRKTGKTTVTATSVANPEVSTTFTVKVISDTSRLYVGSTSMSVPYGSARYMPVVTDSDGDEVPMKWEITHNNPGKGNTQKSGFTLKDNQITCNWPDATCEVTGTVKGSSEYVVVTVKGYKLPEMIAIEPEQVWLEPGEKLTLTLTSNDEFGGWGICYWEASDTGIVTFDEFTQGRSNAVTAKAPGTVLVGAMLENGAAAFCLVNVYDPENRLPGDVNEDGKVDKRDALIVMQYDAGWPVLINGWQGDVNADGKTNLQDAVLILKYDAGLDVQLKQYIPEK